MFITIFSTAAIFHILSHMNPERSLNKTKIISHVCKSLGGPFPSRFPTNTLFAYYIFPVLAAYSVRHTLFCLMALKSNGEK
jgi:hypothetical protein